MPRPESRYVCQACGASSAAWAGRCHVCGAWETLVETIVEPPTRAGRPSRAAAGGRPPGPIPLMHVTGTDVERRPVGIAEVDRVLGGGLVAGSLVLLGGEPGIGKSTLVLEIAAGVAAGGGGAAGDTSLPAAAGDGVLYASGEESAAQLRLRAGRLGLAHGAPGQHITVLAETDVGTVIAAAEASRPGLLIVDSIQTITSEGLEGPAGSIGQVREATARLQAFAKTRDVPVILVGHVTKDGSLAGPKTLEHLVDAVLMLEGERFGTLRLVRATKNRFGSTEEIGVLEMTGEGLREVVDPARAFLGSSATGAPGVVVAAGLEGSRPLLIEIQALVARAGYGMPRRTVAGLDPNRLALLIAVLARRAGVMLASQDVYASVAGGLVIEEPAMDLPLAIALASSLRDRPVRPKTVACGEVGLLGELRPVRGLERRLREAARLGYRRAIVPVAADAPAPAAGDLEVVAAATLRDALAAALVPASPSPDEAGRPSDAVLGSPVP